MEKIKLFVDFDSTLVNSRETALNIFNYTFGQKYSNEQLRKRNFKDLFPLVNEKMIHEVFTSKMFYDFLEFKENSFNILEMYSKFYSIQLVTKVHREGMENKAVWISKNIPSSLIPTIIFVDSGASKKDIDMEGGVFIDDFVENLRETNAKIKILYAPYPDAEECQIDNLDEVYMVSTWHEIGSILEFYRKQGRVI